MTFPGILRVNLVELMVFYLLAITQSWCKIAVSVDSIEAHSALVRWNLTSQDNANITTFKILIHVAGVAAPMEIAADIDASSRSHTLVDLDDKRQYNACVVTVVSPGGTSQQGCAPFTTPTGTGTYLAIVSGVFLFICLIVFSILDFYMSRRGKEDLDNKQEELLEQGWQTFQRNSKLKKGENRLAPGNSRPNSGFEVEGSSAPDDAVEETRA